MSSAHLGRGLGGGEG